MRTAFGYGAPPQDVVDKVPFAVAEGLCANCGAHLEPWGNGAFVASGACAACNLAFGWTDDGHWEIIVWRDGPQGWL